MTKEQIIQIAKNEWIEVYESSITPPFKDILWEVWLKGFNVALSKYSCYTQGDMMAAFHEGARQFHKISDKAFIDWLYETKQQDRAPRIPQE